MIARFIVGREKHITFELTRRREFNQASPDESSYKTRSRRSRPTICSGAVDDRLVTLANRSASFAITCDLVDHTSNHELSTAKMISHGFLAAPSLCAVKRP